MAGPKIPEPMLGVEDDDPVVSRRRQTPLSGSLRDAGFVTGNEEDEDELEDEDDAS